MAAEFNRFAINVAVTLRFGGMIRMSTISGPMKNCAQKENRMSWLKKLFSDGGSELRCAVKYGSDGKVLSVQVPQGHWQREQKGPSTYYTQKANSLLEATELLKKVERIPGNTYYVVETPDGSLGRDMNGFYTEAPIMTENLRVECKRDDAPAETHCLGLTDYGNMMENQRNTAITKTQGYAKLILLMECGACGYKSPIETEAGSLDRQCYCCGTKNKASRAPVAVFLGGRQIVI